MATLPMAGFVLQAITALQVPPVRMTHLVKMEHTMLIPEAKVLRTARVVILVVSVTEKVLVLPVAIVVLAGTVKVALNHQCQTMVVQGINVLQDTTARPVVMNPWNVKEELTG